ncbi:hypothetical protein GCM10029976_090760 [Kribbella albertanoniae]|uniref:Uncharacterized protein n=1 Tax=Kribbella albertanoniae TaxID=1266829 RepID=A0A4R4PJL7_9ACTN|nr:hypothetical protein [Kribbella albertanoniae]TDC22146.1 hypothetical protein E1261_31650 [Kribbella albertanoniae]
MKRLESFKPSKQSSTYAPHTAALMWPDGGYEVALVYLAQSIDGYVSLIPQDDPETGPVDGAVGSPGIGQLVQGFRVLLNGRTGRLDRTQLDSWARYTAAQVGWCLDHEAMAYDCGHGVGKIRAEAEA